MTDSLTGRLWGSIDEIFQQILNHAFVRGLTDGSLDRDRFKFYVIQDALYLRDYARALAICGARAPEEDEIKMFCTHASGAIEVERELHEGFFADFGLSEEMVRSTSPAPTNLAYTSYLLATALHGSFPEALGAVLPCYWIYWEVGKALVLRSSPDALYKRWIETYGSESFAEVVRPVLDLTDRIGAKLGGEEEAKVTDRFVTTARYEWMFWDMGYRMEAWPL
jgi:thiaminase/transcriptional activator TenA